MKRIYTQTEDVTLPTDVKVTFCYKKKTASVKVHSEKYNLDKNFQTPYYGNTRAN